jgi:predicted nucleic acid-binding protein
LERRRAELEKGFARFLERGFHQRQWPFDTEAADHYSQIVLDRHRIGRRIEAFDAMIAGIARSRGADVATRDVADFEACGVQILNPWD